MSKNDKNTENEANIGDFLQLGKYTVLVALFCELSIYVQLSNMLFMMFAGAAPNLISCGNHDFSNILHLKDRCNALSDILHNSTFCDVKLDYQFTSVNIEWNYYCEDSNIVKHSTSIQMIGVMIGSMIFGQISDIFGRKKSLIFSFIGCIVFMLISSFSNNLLIFTIVRFIVNIFNGGIIAVTVVYSIENLPKRDRLWINAIVSWAPNYIIFAGVAYLVQDWRKLAQACAALAVLPLLLLCFMPESVQYLSHKNRIEDATKVIERICRIDGRYCDTTLLKQILNKEKTIYEKKSKKYTYYHLFSRSSLTKYTLAICLSSLITSIVNYSIVFNMEKLSGSIYLNGLFIGLLRWSVNLCLAFMDYRFLWIGRKKVHLSAWILAIISSFTIMLLYSFELEHEYKIIVRICSLSIVSVAAQIYLSIGIVTGELFPTCIRSLASSFGQFHSRIGVVLAPQLFLIADIWEPLPYLFMIVLGIFDMLFFECMIKETKGKSLVENMPPKKSSKNVTNADKIIKLTNEKLEEEKETLPVV